jgi:hypothetical protein
MSGVREWIWIRKSRYRVINGSGNVTWVFSWFYVSVFGKEREMGFGDCENYKHIYSAKRPR